MIYNKVTSNHKCDNKEPLSLNPGLLSVSVHNRLTNEPIPFAVVSVYFMQLWGFYGEAGSANLVARSVTDENGEANLMELPVLDKFLSPLSQYLMVVRHFRYYPVNVYNVQIYPGITAIYDIKMTPLTVESPDFEYIINPELK